MDVEAYSPSLQLSTSEHSDGQLQARGCRYFDLVQQSTAVTQCGTVIEQPRCPLTITVKDGGPLVRVERLVYLAEEIDDTLGHLL